MHKILIAEDDLLIADMVEDILVKHGHEVCGIGRTVEEAVALGRRYKPHIAIIDMTLADGGNGSQVAAQLADMDRLGILYVTGNVSSAMLTGARGHACLSKPYREDDLLRSVEFVAHIVATRHVSMPLPDGLKVLSQLIPWAAETSYA